MGWKKSTPTRENDQDEPEIVLLDPQDVQNEVDESDHFVTNTQKVTSPRRSKSASVCSQNSSDSTILWNTTDDISDLCLMYEGNTPTLVLPPITVDEKRSQTSSKKPLGKRKADDISSGNISTTSASGSRDPLQRNVRPKFSDPFVSAKNADTLSSPPSDHDQPVIIAYSPVLQSYFNSLSIGVQWEIARLVSMKKIGWDDIYVPNLKLLQGNNQESGPKVAQILLDVAAQETMEFTAAIRQEMEAKSPWVELDRESVAFQGSQTAALGCSERDYWYGGKVHFMAKLKGELLKNNERRLFLELERLVLGPSTRCSRRWGSASLLRVNVNMKSISAELYRGKPKKVAEDAVAGFFSRRFVLMGRVYRAYYAKDHTVFLIATNERVRSNGKDGVEVFNSSDSMNTSLEGFIDWFNPLTHNKEQTMVKWSARFALALSNSVPGVILKQDHLNYIDDIVSPGWNGKGKVPNEMIMTDGCGFANATLLSMLQAKYEWENFPTAVQVRIAGAKGLLLLDPKGRYSNSDEPPTVSIRPSQIKIKYSPSEPLDPAMLVIDVLRHTKLVSPGHLGAETIVNLSENGVPTSSFLKLMNDGMAELANGLMTFEGPNAMQILFHNVMRAGGVAAQRLSREYGGESRARGAKYLDNDQPPEDDEIDDEDEIQMDLAIHERSLAWWADQVSGQPSTLEETVMGLLASGFRPQSCSVLAEKLKQVLKRALNSYTSRYRITVPMSASAFIVPDPLGVLEEGEIHVRASSSFFGSNALRGPDGFPTDIIIGDVLVTRHPCKVPSDTQKVKAVEHEKLRQYTDVIIFSTKGARSLASFLGGGDYDGDKVTVIWQPEIVAHFKNADPSFADPPRDIEEKFIKNTESVADFLCRAPAPPAGDASLHVREMQRFLLGALKNLFVVGQYSKMHEVAVYTLGYAHPEAKRLAYMFCTCLDGSKTGLVVNPKVLEEDTKKYGRRSPAWAESVEEAERFALFESNDVHPPRPVNLHKFIMDTLRHEANKAMAKYMNTYEAKVCAGLNSGSGATVISGGSVSSVKYGGTQIVQAQPYDADLVAVYDRARKMAEHLATIGRPEKLEELNKIKLHVEGVRKLHRGQISQHSPRKGKIGKKSGQKGAGFTDLSIQTRQDTLRALSRRFASGPKGLNYFEEEILRKVRASYAYYHDWEMKKNDRINWTRFPWDVATRELCAMKAEAIGSPKTITGEFYEKMNISGFARGPR